MSNCERTLPVTQHWPQLVTSWLLLGKTVEGMVRSCLDADIDSSVLREVREWKGIVIIERSRKKKGEVFFLIISSLVWDWHK